jgi:aminoglycoside phosphotransferase (APT) family kinase protein
LFDLNLQTARQYLALHGYRPEELRVQELTGGVSCQVFLVECPGERFVLKQSLEKLRVEAEWWSARERIFAECAALREVAPLVPSHSVPAVMFEDRENFLFAMTAAPAAALPWKQRLLKGDGDPAVAARVAEILGSLIVHTRGEPRFAAQFGDQTIFDQLRLDPYYRFTATRHPDVRPYINRLLSDSNERRYSLVHGDWSPKNLLVLGGHVTAIDFEVVHYGDPSFDAAFLLNHLFLKTIHTGQPYQALIARFWKTLDQYVGERWLEAATLQHLPALMLARIDGKSPVEYLRDPVVKDRIRRFAKLLMREQPTKMEDTLALYARHF